MKRRLQSDTKNNEKIKKNIKEQNRRKVQKTGQRIQ